MNAHSVANFYADIFQDIRDRLNNYTKVDKDIIDDDLKLAIIELSKNAKNHMDLFELTFPGHKKIADCVDSIEQIRNLLRQLRTISN